MALFDSGYNKAKKSLTRVSGANTGEEGAQKAYNAGVSGAAGIGQTVAGIAASAGMDAGMTKGQAVAASQNVANEETLDNIQNETARAQEEQNAAVKEAENKVGEEAEKMKEKNSKLRSAGTGLASGASAGAMIGSVGGPIGTAIGAGVGGIIGGLAGYFSDDRLKYKSKIIDKRLLGGCK